MLAFPDIVSFVYFGSRFELLEDNDSDVVVEPIGPEEIGDSIFRVDAIAHEVTAAAQRAASLGYPTLPVLGTRWTNAS